MQQIRDVMSQDVKVLNPDATIKDAARQMLDGDFGLMPVGENDRMIGTLSDRDIATRAVAQGRGTDTRVREVMSDGVLWAFDTDSVEKAAQVMHDNQVRRLPVVNGDKRLVGIVALGDLAVGSPDKRSVDKALTGVSQKG